MDICLDLEAQVFILCLDKDFLATSPLQVEEEAVLSFSLRI